MIVFGRMAFGRMAFGRMAFGRMAFSRMGCNLFVMICSNYMFTILHYHINTLYCTVPERGPQIQHLYALSEKTLFLSWKKPSQQFVNGLILGYRIYYRPLGSFYVKFLLSLVSYVNYPSSNMEKMDPEAKYVVH